MRAIHTPGPWAYVENGDANCYQVRDGSGRWLLALLHNGEELTEQQRANLLLIAAAPELLEALELVLDRLVDRNETDEAHTVALAAIAKATGSQP